MTSDFTAFDGFTRAGLVGSKALDLLPERPLPNRKRHRYGDGPFAKLVMPWLPDEPGVYLWEVDGAVVYVGQTRGTLKARLGPNGYSTISRYNTLEREPGKRNGGQQTNCRVNALANSVLNRGESITIWYMVTRTSEAESAEASWMRRHGKPQWNRRIEGRQRSEHNGHT
jgi:hypothetical protein